MKRILGTLAPALGLAAIATPAAAQDVTLAVTKITTTQSCSYFQNSEGRAAAVATPWMVAAASAWRTWWVKDCVANFATMRSTLQAALASSGKLRVGRGGRYSVTVNITNVAGGDAQPTPYAPDRKDYSIARSYMVVSMDVSVRDSAGRAIFGGLLTKKLEVGSNIKVDGFESASNSSGEAAYGRMQNELALAAARVVAFHFVPLEVTATDGREVQLNYGGPLLQLGSLVSVTSPDRRATVRYRVISAESGGFSTAEVDGGGDFLQIVAGSRGTFIEPDSDAANARRFKKVDLP